MVQTLSVLWFYATHRFYLLCPARSFWCCVWRVTETINEKAFFTFTSSPVSLSLSPFVSSAHTGMHHAAYASVLSSLSTPDLQRTFCIASSPIRDPPPAAAPYSFEPVRPFTASASTHGELSTPSWFPIRVEQQFT